MRLITFAEENGFFHPDIFNVEGAYHQRFQELYSMAQGKELSREELTFLTEATQAYVMLPVFTTEQAAAWAGVGIDTIRDAVWRHDPPKLNTIKPGHDVLVLRSDLKNFCTN